MSWALGMFLGALSDARWILNADRHGWSNGAVCWMNKKACDLCSTARRSKTRFACGKPNAACDISRKAGPWKDCKTAEDIEEYQQHPQNALLKNITILSLLNFVERDHCYEMGSLYLRRNINRNTSGKIIILWTAVHRFRIKEWKYKGASKNYQVATRSISGSNTHARLGWIAKSLYSRTTNWHSCHSLLHWSLPSTFLENFHIQMTPYTWTATVPGHGICPWVPCVLHEQLYKNDLDKVDAHLNLPCQRGQTQTELAHLYLLSWRFWDPWTEYF